MSDQYILFGAGTIGRVVARDLIAQGNPPVAFADNDPKKWGTEMEGIRVIEPKKTKFTHHATWIVTVMNPEPRQQLLKQVEEMGVKSALLWDFMAKRYELPSVAAFDAVLALCADDLSKDYLWDQYEFRKHQREQIPMTPMNEIYFPDWITHRDDEHYVDCGAADGDTVKEFIRRWPKFDFITAFEPDPKNYEKLCEYSYYSVLINAAVSDFDGVIGFTSTGDYSAHLGGDCKVWATKLDLVEMPPPTYIKMDIEGSELEALWGAREVIRKHSPVLAICAYHTADHLWQIPLLLHAINPDLKLFLRRYAEGTWETVWYAVPPERWALCLK